MAQAGGKEPQHINEALKAGYRAIYDVLEK
jgi:hypothetical protein